MQDNERKAWQKGGSEARAIGAYVARMLDPIARARGFAITSLLSEWPTVVGEELASFTAPDKLVWPRRTEEREAASPQSAWRNDGAILVLKVDEHVFRLSGHCPASLPPGAPAQGQGPGSRTAP